MESFFGREQILALLKRRVLDLREGYRQNVALLGGRFVGKTTLLKKFIFELDLDHVIPITLDLENSDFPHFVQTTLTGLLSRFVPAQPLSTLGTLPTLIEAAEPRLPQTIKRIKKIQSLLVTQKWAECYREILDLPQHVAQETDSYCLLIFDEFQNLEEFGFPDVYQELGKNIMTQKRCLYVMASSQEAKAKEILAERLSLLFGNFETIAVAPFDLATTQLLVQERFQGLRIPDDLVHFLQDFTGGQPLYLRLITDELKRLSEAHRQQEVFKPLFLQSIQNVLFDPWGTLSRHFELAVQQISSAKGHQLVPSILISLAHEKRKLRDLASRVLGRQNDVKLKLNPLLEQGVVCENGGFYYLKDKLFKYWLRFVLQNRRQVLWSKEECQQEFYQTIEKGLGHFLLQRRKDFSSRVLDLLFCFENETFHINGRKYKLPLFQEVVPTKVRKSTGAYFDLIKATAKETDWLIFLQPDSVSENDISAIVKEAKKSSTKGRRKCIVISFEDMEENARIKALQERMWIWHGDELNTLLNLFDKPTIHRES